MKIEIKNIKLSKDAVQGRTIMGYAAVFNNVDSYKDIIEPGAFKKTLEERAGKVKVAYNHGQLIGRPLVMQEDAKGLYTESVVSKTAKGDEVLELIKDGVITDMSIQYRTILEKTEDNGIRRLIELKLYELGPVDFGANELAELTGVKNLVDKFRAAGEGEADIEEIKKAITTLENMLKLKSEEPPKGTPGRRPLEDTEILMKHITGNYFDALYSAIKKQ